MKSNQKSPAGEEMAKSACIPLKKSKLHKVACHISETMRCDFFYAPFRQILNAIASKAGILKDPFSIELILTLFLISNSR